MAIRRAIRAVRVMGKRRRRQAVAKVGSAARRAYGAAAPRVRKAGLRARGAYYSGKRRASAAYAKAKPRVGRRARAVGRSIRTKAKRTRMGFGVIGRGIKAARTGGTAGLKKYRSGLSKAQRRSVRSAGYATAGGAATLGVGYGASRRRKKRKTTRRRRRRRY